MTGEPTPSGWFLGPKAEYQDVWQRFLDDVFSDYTHWRRNVQPRDSLVIGSEERRKAEPWFDALSNKLDELLSDLKLDFPFFHPRYLAHMTSEQTLPAVLGYFAGMLYNPNNVTPEAAPITVKYEREVGLLVAAMLGYDGDPWAHITSGGTVSTLEALWAARTVQFLPLAMQDGAAADCDAGRWGLRRMLHRLPEETLQRAGELSSRDLADAIGGDYGPRGQGLHRVLNRLRDDGGEKALWPKIFASETSHYSVEKVADVLGYGAQAVRRIPTDAGGRMDVDKLREQILELREGGGYVAAVVATIGSTEMGAVDPLDKIVELREELLEQEQLGFWIHADAAWGGYLATIFRGAEQVDAPGAQLQDVLRAVRVTAEFHNNVTGVGDDVRWPDAETYAAFADLGKADSITIDPHKLGYVPYPAGIVAFKRREVMDVLHQHASYIFESDRAEAEAGAASVSPRPPPIGPYILEGSKPGAAAAACWLAHTTIPLDRSHHGQIVKSTVLSARRLHRYLAQHLRYVRQERARLAAGGDCGWEDPLAVRIMPLGTPDTNIVCYVVRPLTVIVKNANDKTVELDTPECSLECINALNDAVHRRLAEPLPPSDAIDTTLPGTPHSHAYYLSRTVLSPPDYTLPSVEEVLTGIGVNNPQSFKTSRLTVLRSTVMNPHYDAAERASKRDYLYNFMVNLDKVGREVLAELEPQRPKMS